MDDLSLSIRVLTPGALGVTRMQGHTPTGCTKQPTFFSNGTAARVAQGARNGSHIVTACMKTPARQQDHPPKSSEAASHMGNILKCSHNAPLLTQWPHISMSGSIWEVKILGDNIAIVACQPSEAPRISEAWVKVETSQNNLEE